MQNQHKHGPWICAGLQTFVTVAELGTVSKAASRLRVSQSALSRRIGELEAELDLKLFDRIGRRLVLTAVGEQFLGECRGVLGRSMHSASRLRPYGVATAAS